jgi:hypothetical protein
MAKKSVETVLDSVDAGKRGTLRRMAKMAFVAPVVASFPLDGLTLGTAEAADGIASNFTSDGVFTSDN